MALKPKNTKIRDAVRLHGSEGKQGLLEKAFSFAFRGLVYAQIWEDPVVDMEALAITPDTRMITIASGGCNVMSYLVDDPAEIIAVDLNTAHIAYNRLKVTAIKHLPDHHSLYRFFGLANRKENITAYKQYLAPHLDDMTRSYWEGRDLIGRKRISGFKKGIYRTGLLGNFIGIAHLLAKLYKIDLSELLRAENMDEQRRIFEEKLAPVFDKKFIRWLTDQPASLFGLGIPPAQFEALAGDDKMANVLRKRLEKLACEFEIKDNYFAWQAFGRGYGRKANIALPPYLQHANYDVVRDRIERVQIRHANFVELLENEPAASMDRYVLLDAQDWMSDAELNRLWGQITRTAKPGARVLFRTAAEPTLLPGRVSDDILGQWDYREEESLDYTRRDRSSIYGGVHLYVLKN
ncbi:DUF3419 family protein [Alterisphingorhabdus coralli]|uniref:DUF3419 family protein n=1 Tax=Alterisphingorhabdus coralli TaxID=3071408 RepID=A0AA97F5T8_9SPHN|nr:DUF3419 family protein [Parasphingorhabdus sp. SCSIO 66989]WOE73986.1 DUF3419 family protein [Parasphingorhabdus sp. SCSIO 66989]